LGDERRVVDVLEAVPAAVLVAEGGAHPGARILGGATAECGEGEGVAVAGVMEDLETALYIGSAGAVASGGVTDGVQHGSRGDEIGGGGSDGGLDDLERGGVG